MAKFLVTGGLGFVGNEVVRQLLPTDDVWILDNRNRIAPRIGDLDQVPVLEIDITNTLAVKTAFEKIQPDYVIHLAAIHYIPECNENPCRTLRVNVEGTRNIMDACAHSKVKHLVFASSGAVYSDSPAPLAESASVIEPVDVYGYSKSFCEQLARLATKESQINITAVRLFNVFGPRETNPHIIPEILNQLKTTLILHLGNTSTRRDFIYVNDAAEGFIRLAKCPVQTGFRIVNLGTGKDYSMQEIVAHIQEHISRPIQVLLDSSRVRKVDKQVQVADITQLKNILGWEPSFSIDSGIKNLLAFEGFSND